MDEIICSTNSSITVGSPKVSEIDPACHVMDDVNEGSSTSTESEENSSKIVFDGADNNPQLDSSADDSDNEIFNVSKRKISKKSTVLSDDDDSSSESKALPDSRASHKAKDDTDEDSDQEDLSSNKHRIQRPVESDSNSNDSVAADEVPDNTQVKPYQYSRAIFDPDDASDEDEDGSSALTGGRWQSEEQEEEDRLLLIAKTVLNEKSGKPPKVKKVAESVVRAERAKEVSLIHSESQRRVREGPISLPYHRPKQHSLADFINRSKLNSRPVTSGKNNLRQSMRNMEVLRQLEATKKEVVEFYKSASEDEDTEDREWTPAQAPPANSDSEGEDEGCKAGVEEAMEEEPTEALKETEMSVVPLEASDSTATQDLGLEGSEVLAEDESLQKRHSAKSVAGADSGDGELCEAKQSEVLQQSEDQLLSHDEEMEQEKTCVDSKLHPDSAQDDDSVNISSKNSELSLERGQKDEAPMELGGDTSDDALKVKEHSDINDKRESPEKCIESLEDDEDFLPNLNDDTSIARNNENLKRIEMLKLNTQEMEDEDMAELVLLDDEELSEQQESAPGLAVPPVTDAAIVKAPRSSLPPQLSRLAAKLGGAVPLNSVSPAPRLPLTADRDGFIDLDNDFASPKLPNLGLTDLMNRFAKHSATKRQRKQQETVTMSQ